jgi:hypothetical protein
MRFILTWPCCSSQHVQLNRQGADAGTQYRSVIFYEDEVQKEEAMQVPRIPRLSVNPRACCVLRAACIDLFSYELLDWPMNL